MPFDGLVLSIKMLLFESVGETGELAINVEEEVGFGGTGGGADNVEPEFERGMRGAFCGVFIMP